MRQQIEGKPLFSRAAALALLCGALLSAALAAQAAAATPEPVVTPSVYRHGTTAVFGGAVNPEGSPTTYHFEYVDDTGFQASGFAGATSVPSLDASAGSGAAMVSVAEEVTGLAPAVYHLRLVAANDDGSAASAPTAFSVEASGACANEALREEQTSDTLPDGTTGMPACMALEMVSPPAKENQPVKTAGTVLENSVAVDGEHAFFRSSAALGETGAVVNFANGDGYIASRGGDGWTTTAANQRAASGGDQTEPKGFTGDLNSWFQIAPETDLRNEEAKSQAFRFGLAGGPTAFSSLLVAADEPQAAASYAGSSADASHLYIKTREVFGQTVSPARYRAEDPKPAGAEARPNVYVLTLGEDGLPAPMQLLARDGLGKVWGANCGARVGGDIAAAVPQGQTSQISRVQGAISEDGSRVYFSTRPSQPQGVNCNGTTNRMRILERVETPLDGPVISELVQNECSRVSPPCDGTDGDDYFQGASADGNKVYFLTNRQLVNSDLDSGAPCGLGTGHATGCDLYLYEKLPGGGHELIQVSAGDASDPTRGAGAKVLNNIAGISTDGSHVYFAAEGVLTTTPNEFGAVAKAGEPNFYLYERDSDNPEGRTVFIGTLAGGDSGELWGAGKIEAFGPSSVWPVPAMDSTGQGTGGDGHVLLFRSKAGLSPNDTDGSERDVYRFDSQSGSLQCVSCLPGAGPVKNTGEAGSAGLNGLTSGNPQGPAFASLGRWVSEDGEAVVFSTAAPLLPSDTDTANDQYLWRDGQLTRLPGKFTGDKSLTISGNGSEVAFLRTEELLPQDGDSVADLYALRSNGGFPIPSVKEPCIPEVNCQPRQSQPLSPPTPGSETASGSNVPPEPAPVKCRKGFVRRKGKCVKRHHRKKHHHKNRAAGNRQGGLK